MKNVTSVLALLLQVAGAEGAFGQKGDKGEPAVIEPVSDVIVSFLANLLFTVSFSYTFIGNCKK